MNEESISVSKQIALLNLAKSGLENRATNINNVLLEFDSTSQSIDVIALDAKNQRDKCINLADDIEKLINTIQNVETTLNDEIERNNMLEKERNSRLQKEQNSRLQKEQSKVTASSSDFKRVGGGRPPFMEKM